MDKDNRREIATGKRNLIALDETVVKAVYSAVDVERNELILIKIYPTQTG